MSLDGVYGLDFHDFNGFVYRLEKEYDEMTDKERFWMVVHGCSSHFHEEKSNHSNPYWRDFVPYLPYIRDSDMQWILGYYEENIKPLEALDYSVTNERLIKEGYRMLFLKFAELLGELRIRREDYMREIDSETVSRVTEDDVNQILQSANDLTRWMDRTGGETALQQFVGLSTYIANRRIELPQAIAAWVKAIVHNMTNVIGEGQCNVISERVLGQMRDIILFGVTYGDSEYVGNTPEVGSTRWYTQRRKAQGLPDSETIKDGTNIPLFLLKSDTSWERLVTL